jgi:hypothetical protein
VNGELFLVQFGSTAGVCALGLALAVALRRRLGRPASLAIAAFVVLAAAQVVLLLSTEHFADTFADAARTKEPDEVADIVYTSARMRAVLGGVSAVGFVLLLAAVVAGRGKNPRRK